MYTDGVTEATDRAGAFFTDARLRAAVAGHGGRSAEQLAAAVLGQVAAFAGGAPPADDIAVLVIRRVAESAAEGDRQHRRGPPADRVDIQRSQRAGPTVDTVRGETS